MRPGTPTVRLAAVIATAALVLHELRYLVGFGGHAGDALAARGHDYLPLAGGLACLLLALAAAQLLAALDRARKTAHTERTPGFLRLWPALAIVLLVVYSGQEVLEAALSHGQDLGPATVLADGGWSALPLAVALGAAAALLLRGAGRAVRRAAPGWRGSAPGAASPRTTPARVPVCVLALHLAGRAPPAPLPSN